VSNVSGCSSLWTSWYGEDIISQSNCKQHRCQLFEGLNFLLLSINIDIVSLFNFIPKSIFLFNLFIKLTFDVYFCCGYIGSIKCNN
jgi:hypothetical protein